MANFFNNLNINSLIIDMVLIFIIIYNIIKAARQGFISSLISFTLLIISYILVWPLSKIISRYIYNEYLRNIISNIIIDKLQLQGFSSQDMLNNLLNIEVSWIDNSFSKMFQNIDNNLSLSEIGNVIADKFIYPILNMLICVIVLIVISFIFSVIIKLLKKIFKCFSYIPILGKFNLILGGILGVFKSIIVVIFMSLIIDSLIFISNDNWNFLNSTVKKETYILKNIDKLIKIDGLSFILDKVNNSSLE